MLKHLKILTLSVAVFAMAGCATTETKTTSATAPGVVKPYPLKTCIVTGDDLDKDAFVFVYQGQEIKLCCEPCKGDFDKKPSKYLKKLAKK